MANEQEKRRKLKVEEQKQKRKLKAEEQEIRGLQKLVTKLLKENEQENKIKLKVEEQKEKKKTFPVIVEGEDKEATLKR